MDPSNSNGTKFDPRPHLIQLRSRGGVGDYLPVQKRVLWLRTEYPDATTEIELLHWSEDFALARATVTIPGRGSATDYGSETKADFGDYIEKACTKALGRALAGLGFGTQFCGDELDLVNPDGTAHVVDTPVQRRTVHSPARINPDAPYRRAAAGTSGSSSRGS